MNTIKSPTGVWEVRNDSCGLGNFLAPRGDRVHPGIDLVCTAGQDIYAPVDGKYQKFLDPYGDGKYKGLRIINHWCIIDLLYVFPGIVIGDGVVQSQIIGKAEAIGDKYGDDMIHHIHMKVVINPVMLRDGDFRCWAMESYL